VESNNHGLVTNKALARLWYTPLYRQRSVTKATNGKPSEYLGWRTSVITKPLAIGELNGALRDNQLHLFDAETQIELRSYIREGDGKMHGSPFDDRVMSLAIANQMLKFVWLREFQPVREPPPGTFGWFERKLFGEHDRLLAKKNAQRQRIGTNYVRSNT